ncbi:MAG: aromatic hydrocarbon degradation outer membrane protein, partial [Verrucomicrobiaceae bacterium]|nr:aromatic hydrocarbon degradation outer membrane protein [Verrucomicrobiaceae bacterium]
VPGKFHYDSDIETKLPQKVALGTSWQATSRLRLSAQADWINWADAFDKLNVHLSNGSNPAINGLLQSNKIDDTINLDWKDRFVYRAGAEYALTGTLTLRAGYAYGKSPVPDQTLLPMTAAISEHTLGIGLGYNGGSYHVDLGYQRDLNATQHAGSGITGTEYDNSTVNISANWLALTLGFNF